MDGSISCAALRRGRLQPRGAPPRVAERRASVPCSAHMRRCRRDAYHPPGPRRRGAAGGSARGRGDRRGPPAAAQSRRRTDLGGERDDRRLRVTRARPSGVLAHPRRRLLPGGREHRYPPGSRRAAVRARRGQPELVAHREPRGDRDGHRPLGQPDSAGRIAPRGTRSGLGARPRRDPGRGLRPVGRGPVGLHRQRLPDVRLRHPELLRPGRRAGGPVQLHGRGARTARGPPRRLSLVARSGDQRVVAGRADHASPAHVQAPRTARRGRPADPRADRPTLAHDSALHRDHAAGDNPWPTRTRAATAPAWRRRPRAPGRSVPAWPTSASAEIRHPVWPGEP